MKEYIEIRIMKRTVMIIAIIFILICSMSGYYVWCKYHPFVQINISYGGTGKEGIKIQAPHIAISPTGIAHPAPEIELRLNNISMQHEFLCHYIRDTYKSSDIQLDMEMKDNHTILNYHGTVTTYNDEVTDYHNKIELEFPIDANIIK